MLKLIKTTTLIIVVLGTLLANGFAADTFPQKAIEAAEDFARSIDNEEFQEAYLNSASLLQLLHSEEDWIRSIRPTRDLLGQTLERSIKAVKMTSEYFGLPDGNYVLVYFETKMENKKKAAEIVLMCEENTIWQPCSYSIK